MKRTMVLLSFAAALALTVVLPTRAQERPSRLLSLDDLFALKDVGDPRVSPDGAWVAYTVRSLDAKEDSSDTDIWMVPFAGGDPQRLTASKKAESSPRWSPDGRYLAFLSAREGKTSQVWLLPRQGGEAVKLTDFKGGVSSLEWSPDAKRLALVVSDPDPDEAEAAEGEKEKPKTPKPIVLNRLQFKRDGQGYMRDLRRHVHVFDVAAKTSAQVTTGPYDDGDPVWSPDGQWLAFVSNRTPEPDANDNSDIFVIRARTGETPRALTTAVFPFCQDTFSTKKPPHVRRRPRDSGRG